MSDDSVDHLRAFLESMGLDDTADPQLADTPERFTEMLEELFSGLDDDPPTPSTFAPPDNTGDCAPVVIAGIRFHSMCAHHLVPFFGTVDVAYLPRDRMIGFGSVGRIVDHFAKRPQVQERMIAQIAEYLEETLQPTGLLVRLKARQMCMEIRGAKKRSVSTSIAARGDLTEGPLRGELLQQFDEPDQSL